MENAKSGEEYRIRIVRAAIFIQNHLTEELHLSVVADAACFSPFHFHRIFSAFMNETPAEYTKRLRLEKAANLLLLNNGTKITSIAMDCGFATPSAFSRDFKKHFMITPGLYCKKKLHTTISRSTEKKRDQESVLTAIRIETRAPVTVACALYIGDYGPPIGKTWGTLMRWAGQKKLITPKLESMGIAWDNPSVTNESKRRYEACIIVDDAVTVSGEIYKRQIPGGLWLASHFTGEEKNINEAYSEMYYRHLPESGYIPGDFPAIEKYLSPITEKRPSGKRVFDIEIAIPILPLS